MNNLSVVVATYNEEKNIDRCLSSIHDLADEIIIVDAKSKDNTIKIAKKYQAKIFIVDNQLIFHKNKQYGLNKASQDWILQLDADEVVSDQLKNEIKKVIGSNTNLAGFYLPRKNYFLGKWLKKGGLYPDGVIRLVRKGKAFFPCQSVHEQIKVNGQVGWLTNPLLHYSYPTLADYLTKANRYTTLTAYELKKSKLRANFFNTLNYCLIIPLKTFYHIFIKHKGFLDGFPGFLWAFLSSFHYFFAYAKFLTIKNSKN